MSICSGAFAIAAAGILDGRRATTHWQRAEELQRRYPAVQVVADKLFIDDGDVLTSAGVTAGIDLCLHIISEDFGTAAANARARSLVAPPRRSGDQRQYVAQLAASAAGSGMAELQKWVLEHLTDDIDVDAMAHQAHLSRRTLIRRFHEQVGTPPIAWLIDARLDRARELLETTNEPVERISELCGLGSSASLRALFAKRLGVSPREYRSAFRAPRQTKSNPASMP